MNYYSPNLYQNYSSQYMPTYTPQIPQMNTGINGKVVDTIDMVKAVEVPMGGYGIFPKADLSEVYAKVWNSNGTTNIVTFKPCAEDPVKDPEEVPAAQILERISELENKIDSLISTSQLSNKPIKVEDRKGININDY